MFSWVNASSGRPVRRVLCTFPSAYKRLAPSGLRRFILRSQSESQSRTFGRYSAPKGPTNADRVPTRITPHQTPPDRVGTVARGRCDIAVARDYPAVENTNSADGAHAQVTVSAIWIVSLVYGVCAYAIAGIRGLGVGILGVALATAVFRSRRGPAQAALDRWSFAGGFIDLRAMTGILEGSTINVRRLADGSWEVQWSAETWDKAITDLQACEPGSYQAVKICQWLGITLDEWEHRREGKLRMMPWHELTFLPGHQAAALEAAYQRYIHHS
jgi:hypothetical protein